MSFASMIISEEYVLELHSITHGGFSIRYCSIYLSLFVPPLVFGVASTSGVSSESMQQ